MLIGLATGEEEGVGGGGEEESHSKVGTLLGPTKIRRKKVTRRFSLELLNNERRPFFRLREKVCAFHSREKRREKK